jgi:hypothetical protein
LRRDAETQGVAASSTDRAMQLAIVVLLFDLNQFHWRFIVHDGSFDLVRI